MKSSDLMLKQKTYKVFLVDDHHIMREGLKLLINKEKEFEVCGEADSIATALHLIGASTPDAVIIDLSLEFGSGIRLIENLVYTYPGLPILVFSIYDESIYAERCLKAGARGYIMKHSPAEEMISALKAIVNKEIFISDKLNRRLINKFVSNNLQQNISHVEVLSNRELEVYQLFGSGLKKKEIAKRLNLSVKTIETYTEHIKRKMNYQSSHDLLLHAFKFIHDCRK